MNDEGQLWLVGVTLVVFSVWFVHFALALRSWLAERTARAFQVWYIALMIQAGMTSILIGTAARAWPSALFLEDLRLFVAPILTWMLLSGGVVALWTWSRPDRRW